MARRWTLAAKASDWYVIAVIAVFLGYVAGAASLAWVRLPHGDEGHFANAGYEFAHHGRLAMPMWTAWVPSLDRYMFVTMPLYFLQLGVWINLFGIDLRAIRLNCVFWGLIFVFSWYVILRLVSRDRITALLGLALLGLNYDIMNLTSGRYDPMCAALNTAAVAWYLACRENHLHRAVLGANLLLASAVMTHPYGVFGMIGFLCLFVLLDWRRLSLSLVMLAVLPYLVAFSAWGYYISQDVGEFRRQLSVNAQGRLSYLGRPVDALISEVRERYLRLYSGWREDVPVYMRVKVVFLVAYLVGFVGCVFAPGIRGDRAKQALLLWAVAGFMVLTLLDSTRSYIYLIHVIPPFIGILALWFRVVMQRGPVYRVAVVASVTAFAIFSIASVAYRARINDYSALYQPTLRFLQKSVEDEQLVMGGGEFGPGLGFERHLLDDPLLGFRNAKISDFIVVDKLHDERMRVYKSTNPAVHRYIEDLLRHYDLVYENRRPYNYYLVYRLRER